MCILEGKKLSSVGIVCFLNSILIFTGNSFRHVPKFFPIKILWKSQELFAVHLYCSTVFAYPKDSLLCWYYNNWIFFCLFSTKEGALLLMHNACFPFAWYDYRRLVFLANISALNHLMWVSVEESFFFWYILKTKIP